jgi:hypothetical protein
VTPQRKWTVHLAHHSHYDIGYTDTQNQVMASQMAYIDSALELATLTDDWPDDAKFRWNIEVNWPLQQWLRHRPQWAREELTRRVREGRIEVHALPFSMHTEAYSFDELAQQLRFTAEVRDSLGIDVVTAMQTDVPGATIGLSTLLSDAGVKYFVVAHNYAGRSIPHHLDGQELERPFWWQAPDGEKVLVWYTDTLNGSAYMEAMHVGFGAGTEDVLGSLPEYLSTLARQRYPYGAHDNWIAGSTAGLTLTNRGYPHDVLQLRVQGAYADNASTSLLPSRIVREWNETWAWPKLRMSVNRDFFADVEERLGNDLPTYTGDWTDWWADGIGPATVALAKNRQSQGNIRSAQTLHALADGLTDAPLPSVTDDVRTVYENMALFDEHTWGAANPWSRDLIGESSGEIQWTRKHAYALQAEEGTRSLLDGGLKRFSPLAHVTRDDLVASLLVFNPSSFVRTWCGSSCPSESSTSPPSSSSTWRVTTWCLSSSSRRTMPAIDCVAFGYGSWRATCHRLAMRVMDSDRQLDGRTPPVPKTRITWTTHCFRSRSLLNEGPSRHSWIASPEQNWSSRMLRSALAGWYSITMLPRADSITSPAGLASVQDRGCWVAGRRRSTGTSSRGNRIRCSSA